MRKNEGEFLTTKATFTTFEFVQDFCQAHACFVCMEQGLHALQATDEPPRNTCEKHAWLVGMLCMPQRRFVVMSDMSDMSCILLHFEHLHLARFSHIWPLLHCTLKAPGCAGDAINWPWMARRFARSMTSRNVGQRLREFNADGRQSPL